MDVDRELAGLSELFREWDEMRRRGASVSELEREVPGFCERVTDSRYAETVRWWLERDVRKMKERDRNAR